MTVKTSNLKQTSIVHDLINYAGGAHRDRWGHSGVSPLLLQRQHKWPLTIIMTAAMHKQVYLCSNNRAQTHREIQRERVLIKCKASRKHTSQDPFWKQCNWNGILRMKGHPTLGFRLEVGGCWCCTCCCRRNAPKKCQPNPRAGLLGR